MIAMPFVPLTSFKSQTGHEQICLAITQADATTFSVLIVQSIVVFSQHNASSKSEIINPVSLALPPDINCITSFIKIYHNEHS